VSEFKACKSAGFFVALATAAKEGLPLTPLWTLPAHPSITLFPSNNQLM